MNKSFDVFLSHNSKDKPAVRELAVALRARGLQVWLDEWELIPGRPWQEALEEIIETTRSSAVLVGKDGLGPWQDAEMRGCLSEFVERKQPVIPVLLPGAPEVPRLPFFLKRFTWVDLRGGLTEEGLDRLQWGITGTDRSKLPSIPTAAPEVAMAAAEVPPTSAEVRPVQPEVEAPTAVAKERPGQKALALWGVPAWITLLMLLGLVLFLLDHYSPRSGKPEAVDQETGTPGTGTCFPGKEREEDGIVYLRICPGTFTMGETEKNAPEAKSTDSKPAHQVTLSEFWMGKTEVTNNQYRRFRPNHQGEDMLPVTEVSWFDAKAACEYFGGRLPTEAEWEYAARAGSGAAWSFGDDEKLLGEYAWYDKNSGDMPHPVGTKKPNAWGLHDMHGNAWEWIADWYAPYPPEAQSDPTGPAKGEARVVRGGGFGLPPWVLRSALRGLNVPEFRDRNNGFRCARGSGRQP